MFYKRRMTITCDDINLERGWGGGGSEGLGGGGCIVEMSKLKIMPIVSCFKRLTCLFLFIMVEVSIQPQHTLGRPMNSHYGDLV